MTNALLSSRPSINPRYTQLRWTRLLQCVSHRSFSFTDASHMLTFRVERWGAAANPEEDYGKMWCHYTISTSDEMRQRLKEVMLVVVVVEGKTHVSLCLYVLWIKPVCLILSHFQNQGEKKSLWVPCDMWTMVGCIVFRLCWQSDATKSYKNSRLSHSDSHQV